MTAGVLAVFVILGGVISAVGTGLARVLPLANLAIGAVVAGVGAALLVRPGWTLGVSVGNPVAARPHLVAGRTIRAFTLFGAAYGVASLGCTLPIFLVVMAQALAAGGWLPGVGVFAAYGLGMGSVLVALSVAAGAGRAVLVGRARQVGRYLRPAGAVGMVAAGGYLIYYQLVVGRALMGVP
jgi:cytochrome c biogenesis protein CcdA